MKHGRSFAAAVAVATAGITLFATPVYADTYEYQIAVQGDLWAYANAYSGNEYGNATFEEDGDEIYIEDTKTDGMRVAAFWSVPSLGRTGLCVSKGGNQALLECDKNFAEGHTIYIRFAGRCDGNVSPCDKLSQYSNGAATDSTRT